MISLENQSVNFQKEDDSFFYTISEFRWKELRWIERNYEWNCARIALNCAEMCGIAQNCAILQESRIQGIKESRNQGFKESWNPGRNQGIKESWNHGIKNLIIIKLNFPLPPWTDRRMKNENKIFLKTLK